MPSRRTPHRALTIARHEYGVLIRSKIFLLGLLLPTAFAVFVMWQFARDGSAARRSPMPVPVAQPVFTPSGEGAGEPAPTAAGTPERDREGADSGARSAVPLGMAFAFVYLMFMGIVGVGQRLLTSLIEEKNSRVIEVLLSAVSPLELMTGKILGLGAAGLTAMALCSGILVSAAALLGLVGSVPVQAVVWFVVYYVLGFLLAASVFAGVGSACNTTREAQQLLMPLMIPFLIPLVCWLAIAQRPEGLLATVLSFLPPTAAMTMVLRMAVDPGVGPVQIALSLLVLVLSVPLAIWAAAKVFRTGILMYGKPPRLRELLRWVRQA